MGESNVPACGPPATSSAHLASVQSLWRVCPQIQGSQCGAYVGAVEEMMCVWMLQRGHSGDGCVMASTFCKYDLRKGDLFVLSWAKGVTSEAGNSLFRAVNVWWRCAQYFVIASCG